MGMDGILDGNRDQVDLRRKKLDEIVMGLSGALDPILYVLLMKRRLELLTTKVNKLQNTVDVWKNESFRNEKMVKELSSKLQFLRKKVDK
jgi:hypothetical protein